MTTPADEHDDIALRPDGQVSDQSWPAVVLHTRTQTEGMLVDGAWTRIVAISLDGRRIEVLGDSPIGLNAGPGPTTLTVTLFVGEVTIQPEGTP